MAKAFAAKVEQGARVGDVSPDSPAQRAGLERGNIILDVNGKPVSDSNQLRMSISMMQPDSTVALRVLRDGSMREMTAKLGELQPTGMDAHSLLPSVESMTASQIFMPRDLQRMMYGTHHHSTVQRLTLAIVVGAWVVLAIGACLAAG